jgi:hypothetical protein
MSTLFKHKNFGRVGAIKLERLDELLLSLKNYWDYGNNQTWPADTNTIIKDPGAQQLYEL